MMHRAALKENFLLKAVHFFEGMREFFLLAIFADFWAQSFACVRINLQTSNKVLSFGGLYLMTVFTHDNLKTVEFKEGRYRQ